MKKRVKLSMLCVAALFSCNQESMLIEGEGSLFYEENVSEENLSTGNFVGVATSTYQNVVQYLKFGVDGRQTRSMQEVSSMLEPYVMDGDTVAWIANYDEGWELLSNDRRSPLVLARSESGRFSLDSENEAAADFIREMLNQQYMLHNREFEDNDTIHGDWSVYYLPAESISPEEIIHNQKATRLSQDPDDGEEHYGYWLLLSQTDLGTNITTHPHAITTHWDQHMNTYIPNQCVAGCVGVAGAQYLYYLYTQNHRPATIVNTASLNLDGAHYSFFGNSATVWNNISNSHYRDLLIGYVAESVGTEFGLSSSSSSTATRLVPFINSFGYSLSSYSYTANNITSGIYSKGALLFSMHETSGGGHSLIIDYLRKESHLSRCLYGWIETDRSGQPIYNLNPPYDESMFEYTVIQNRTSEQSFMRMNWGWNDSHDDNDYSLAAFPIDSYNYDFHVFY
ncbi:MAG: C10 family peptidase [Bacteroidaceae bacterium]|nr:C10 family peptidase [Bacteroidaceae bacterium]